jgi:hypothetical protein
MEDSATVTDVVLTLAKPEEYVRRIVENYYTFGFNREKAVTRVGTTGKGLSPNYSIEQDYEVPREVATDGGPIVVRIQKRHVFSGRQHKEILEDSAMGISWSSRSMSFVEVSALLGKLRKGLK